MVVIATAALVAVGRLRPHETVVGHVKQALLNTERVQVAADGCLDPRQVVVQHRGKHDVELQAGSDLCVVGLLDNPQTLGRHATVDALVVLPILAAASTNGAALFGHDVAVLVLGVLAECHISSPRKPRGRP